MDFGHLLAFAAGILGGWFTYYLADGNGFGLRGKDGRFKRRD